MYFLKPRQKPTDSFQEDWLICGISKRNSLNLNIQILLDGLLYSIPQGRYFKSGLLSGFSINTI